MRNLILSILFITSTLFSYSQSDNCVGATSLTASSSCTTTGYNITNAFSNSGQTTTCGTGNDDGWFTFTATGTNTVIEATCTNGDDIILTALSGGCGSLSEVGCVDGNGNGGTEILSITTVVGVQYWVQILNQSNSAVSGNICVYSPSSTNTSCNSATPICSNSSLSGNSSGYGTQELNATNSGCLFTEHQSSWYTFTINTSGTLDFTISPVNGTDDYDFAVWGPASACPPTVAPVRCSYAAGGGNTGLLNGSGDNSESAFGDKFVEDMNVIAGETYILLIDNFSSTTSPFNLTWGGTSTLDCTVLPIELVYFDGSNNEGVNNIYWVTATEINNDYFELQRSEEGYNYTTIATIKGSGNSNTSIMYGYKDENPFNEISYYRLKQVDFDGNFEYHNVISIKTIDDNNNFDAIVYPNPNSGTFKIGDMNLDDIRNIVVINSIGEVVYESEIYNGVINITDKQNGIYIVTIFTNDGTIYRRMLKR